ncbi:MAG: GAK system ATP-grasp enzyme [Nitrospinae bacterium]|nr:GAK system ATP-grasp enzyme [Nitrospinota bacterium]
MKRIAVAGIPGGWSTERLAQAVERRTGFSAVIDVERMSVDMGTGRIKCAGADMGALDGVIVKKIGEVYSPNAMDRLEILRAAGKAGTRFFSSPENIGRMLNRASCTATLALGGIPMPPTVITEGVEDAVDAVERFGEAVFKPMFSTKARGMALISSGSGARDEVERFKIAGNPVMYIQKKISLPGRDLGLAFLGGEYLAAYARVSRGSWNTTINSGGKYEKFSPPKEMIDMAGRAQSLFGLDFTGVDIAETSDGPVVFEVSAFGGFRGLLEGCGVDAAQLYADYVIRKVGNGD